MVNILLNKKVFDFRDSKTINLCTIHPIERKGGKRCVSEKMFILYYLSLNFEKYYFYI